MPHFHYLLVIWSPYATGDLTLQVYFWRPVSLSTDWTDQHKSISIGDKCLSPIVAPCKVAYLNISKTRKQIYEPCRISFAVLMKVSSAQSETGQLLAQLKLWCHAYWRKHCACQVPLWQFLHVPFNKQMFHFLLCFLKGMKSHSLPSQELIPLGCREKKCIPTCAPRSFTSSTDHLPSYCIQTNIPPSASQVANFWNGSFHLTRTTLKDYKQNQHYQNCMLC